MKVVEMVWSCKDRKYVEIEEALKRRCLRCSGRLVRANDVIKCESCGGTVDIIKKEVWEGREWVRDALNRRILTFQGHSWGGDVYGDLYSLSVKLPPEVWQKVSEYFFYLDEDVAMEPDFDEWGSIFGFRRGIWVTTEPDKVEEILFNLANQVATEIEREEAELERKRSEEMERMLKEEERKKKEEMERKKREEKEAEERIEEMKNELKKLKVVREAHTYLDWEFLREHGCKHNDVEDMKCIMKERYGSIYSFREFEVYEDPCTNFVIVFDKLHSDCWSWTIFEKSEQGEKVNESEVVKM